MKTRSLIVALTMLYLLQACKKESLDIPFVEIEVPGEGAVRSMYLLNDSLILVGGDYDSHGFIAVAELGAKEAVVLRNNIQKECYSIGKSPNKWYIGGDSLDFFTGDSIQRMKRYFWNEPDWVSDLSKHPIQDIAADKLGILAVAGRKLAFGVIYHSYDGGETWNPIEPDNELRCAAIKDGVAWVGGNGMLVRTQWGSGVWERLRLKDRFIVDLSFQSAETGLALTINGALLQTNDGGDTWEELVNKRMAFMHRMAVDRDFIIAVGEKGGLLYKTGTDAAWQERYLNEEMELNDVLIQDGRCYIATSEGKVIHLSLDDLK